jgi:import receptor subunit TOM70
MSLPIPREPRPIPLVEVPAPPSSLWDRISTWASEHKGVVYTVAGVTLVVTAAGTIYYLSDSGKGATPPASPSGKRKSKKDRKKAKKEAEESVKEEPKTGNFHGG